MLADISKLCVQIRSTQYFNVGTATGFWQGDPSATGTTSSTEWACQGDDRNVGFTQIVQGEVTAFSLFFAVVLPCSVDRVFAAVARNIQVFQYIQKALGKGIPVAQPRLQTQIGHAKETRGTSAVLR